MNRAYIILFWILLVPGISFSQGINNLWMMGYGGPQATAPFGGIDMNFFSGSPVISYSTREMEFRRAVSTICDSSGNLLFVTNGVYVANATGDTMQNGSGLNPSVYTSWYPDGLPPPQMNIIIPDPGNTDLYYLFHTTIDDPFAALLTRNLHFSIIDMGLNSGLGAVIVKNQVLLNDSLCKGNLTACKHANGRDWWLISHKAYSTFYYRFLITPFGIQGPFMQSIGIVRENDVGQAAFSPDGRYFACYNLRNQHPAHFEAFSFDRCTGLLSTPVYVAINDSSTAVGVAFSPNSQYLFVSSTNYVYQFDVTSANIVASQTVVAVWDGFYSPNPPFATKFDIAQLAPDGKIYISTGNGTLHLHVINQPDNAGLACDLVQHGVPLPAYNFNSLPNHPNYFLGNLPGSPCDSLTNIQPDIKVPPEISAFPNPSNGIVTFQFPVRHLFGTIELYDIIGNMVLSESISAWSQFKKVDISKFNAGIYFCRMQWQGVQATLKVFRE